MVPPGTEISSVGSPGTHISSVGSLGTHISSVGSFGTQISSVGSPGTQLSSVGSPGTQISSVCSSGTQISSVGSSGTQISYVGSSGTQISSVGSPAVFNLIKTLNWTAAERKNGSQTKLRKFESGSDTNLVHFLSNILYIRIHVIRFLKKTHIRFRHSCLYIDKKT